MSICESLGNYRPRLSYELARKPAAKVVCLGDSSVGKTSIIVCLKDGYTADKLKDRLQSTIGITSVGEISLEVDGGSVRLDMWDTCGQEQFRTFTSSYFRGAQGAVLVYDVTRKETLAHLFKSHDHLGECVPSWLDQFLDHFKQFDPTWVDSEPPRIAVLGNKSDLTYEQMVSVEEAKETIDREMKSRKLEYVFYETSALTGQNVKEFAKEFASKFPRCHTPNIQTRGLISIGEEPPSPDKNESKQCRC